MISAFSYTSPRTVQQAVGALGDAFGKAEILAGGTDLVNLLKEGLVQPATVVNIKKIPGLSGITVGDAEIRIGATTTLAEIAGHSAIRKHLPALAQAAEVLGGPQIRNMGTIGGNLCQRNRDWYFRLGLSPKVREESQYGAIFPMEGADYVNASTLAPALVAYGASVQVAGPNTVTGAEAAGGAAEETIVIRKGLFGRRRVRVVVQSAEGASAASGAGPRNVPVAEFFQVSDFKNKRETILAPNELVTGVTIPVGRGLQSADYEVRERDSHDWPLVQASVALDMDGDRVRSAVIVLGHVAPLPLRSKAAEAALAGKGVDADSAAAAGKAAAQGAKPTAKNAYKVTLTEVAVKRALLAAVGNRYWTK